MKSTRQYYGKEYLDRYDKSNLNLITSKKENSLITSVRKTSPQKMPKNRTRTTIGYPNTFNNDNESLTNNLLKSHKKMKHYAKEIQNNESPLNSSTKNKSGVLTNREVANLYMSKFFRKTALIPIEHKLIESALNPICVTKVKNPFKKAKLVQSNFEPPCKNSGKTDEMSNLIKKYDYENGILNSGTKKKKKVDVVDGENKDSEEILSSTRFLNVFKKLIGVGNTHFKEVNSCLIT